MMRDLHYFLLWDPSVTSLINDPGKTPAVAGNCIFMANVEELIGCFRQQSCIFSGAMLQLHYCHQWSPVATCLVGARVCRHLLGIPGGSFETIYAPGVQFQIVYI